MQSRYLRRQRSRPALGPALAALAGAGALTGPVRPAAASLVNSSWVGPQNGSWTAARNWAPPVVPDNGADQYVVTLPGGSSAQLCCTTVTIDGISIERGALLQIVDGASDGGQPATLRLGGSPFQNDGLVVLTAPNAQVNITLLTDVDFIGTGSVVLGPAVSATLQGSGAGRVLHNGPSHTIKGAGGIGTSGAIHLFNEGLIEATGPAQLTVAPIGNDSVNFNPGFIHANGGTLKLQTGGINNTGGEVFAEDGSTIVLSNMTLSAGTLGTSGSGVVSITAPTTLKGVDLAGDIEVSNGVVVSVAGSTTNTGVLRLNGTSILTDLSVAGGTTFTGSGAVELAGTGSARLIDGSAGPVINSPGHTLRGHGKIQLSSLTNQSTVRSEGGELRLINTNVNNAGGQLVAGPGSQLTLENAAITGGSIVGQAGGAVVAGGIPTVAGVTITGAFTIPDSNHLGVGGAIENDGVMSLSSTGLTTTIRATPDLTLTGNGTIQMSGQSTNSIYTMSGLGSGITNGASHTIRGAGTINGLPTLVNHGALVGDVAPGLTLQASDSITNDGSMTTSAPGSISIVGFESFTTSGVVAVGPGSVFSRAGNYNQTGGSTLVNGTLSLTSGGIIQLSGGSLSGVGSISGGVVNVGGAVAPGTPTGVLLVNGFLAQSAGSFNVSVGGTPASGLFSSLHASATLALGGTLVVKRIPGFSPAPTDLYTIMTGSARFGTFANVSSCDPVEVTYLSNAVQIRFPNGAVAHSPDINGDGHVDGADLGLLLGGWGQCADACCGADLNDDGVVSGADLGILLGHWTG